MMFVMHFFVDVDSKHLTPCSMQVNIKIEI
jgi:hypothetical protein